MYSRHVLYHSYLNKRRSEMAILLWMGMPLKKICLAQGLHLFTLGFLGTIGSVIMTLILFPLLNLLIKAVLPLQLSLQFSQETFFSRTMF